MHISKPLPRLFVFFLRSANLQVHWPRGLLLMDWCRLEVDGRPYIEDCPRGDVRWLWGRHIHRRRNSAGLAVVKDEETLSVPLIAPRRQLSGDVFDPLRSVRRASYRIQLFFPTSSHVHRLSLCSSPCRVRRRFHYIKHLIHPRFFLVSVCVCFCRWFLASSQILIEMFSPVCRRGEERSGGGGGGWYSEAFGGWWGGSIDCT